jgi:hypothetical protein
MQSVYKPILLPTLFVAAGQFRAELRRSITSLKLRMKDVEAGRQLETDLAGA